MRIFNTTPEQRVRTAELVVQMKAKRLPLAFVDQLHLVAMEDQGVFELMELWAEAKNATERESAEVALQETLDDIADAPQGVQQRPRVNFDGLPAIVEQVSKHKAKLRALIDSHGGVSNVARAAGILQPALSRMLNSGSMPRRTTLFKLARAMDVDESEVVGEWVR